MTPWETSVRPQRLRGGRGGFHPRVGKIPWRAWLPAPVFGPGGSHGQRSLVGYDPRGRKGSDTAEVSERADRTPSDEENPAVIRLFSHSASVLGVPRLFHSLAKRARWTLSTCPPSQVEHRPLRPGLRASPHGPPGFFRSGPMTRLLITLPPQEWSSRGLAVSSGPESQPTLARGPHPLCMARG